MKLIAVILLGILLVGIPVFSAKEESAPAKAVDIPLAERPCLAVVSFDDGSLQRQEWWGPKWDVGSGLADILTTVLLEKNRFRLLERSLLEKVFAEQDLGKTGRVNPQTAAQIGRVIGADYLIMGKVTQFNWEKKSTGGIIPLGGIAGIGGSKTKARVSVDLRVVDSDTAEILGSYSGNGEDSRTDLVVGHSEIGGFAIDSSDFMGTILGQATKKAITQWADNFCRALDESKVKLVPKHRPVIRPDGVVLNVEGTMLIANTGSAKGYAVGDRVEIHKKGKELRDPDTGEVLRVMTELIGTGTIVKIDEKTADILFAPANPAVVASEGDLVKSVSGVSSPEAAPVPPPVSTPEPPVPSGSN